MPVRDMAILRRSVVAIKALIVRQRAFRVTWLLVTIVFLIPIQEMASLNLLPMRSVDSAVPRGVGSCHRFVIFTATLRVTGRGPSMSSFQGLDSQTTTVRRRDDLFAPVGNGRPLKGERTRKPRERESGPSGERWRQ